MFSQVPKQLCANYWTFLRAVFSCQRPKKLRRLVLPPQWKIAPPVASWLLPALTQAYPCSVLLRNSAWGESVVPENPPLLRPDTPPRHRRRRYLAMAAYSTTPQLDPASLQHSERPRRGRAAVTNIGRAEPSFHALPSLTLLTSARATRAPLAYTYRATFLQLNFPLAAQLLSST